MWLKPHLPLEWRRRLVAAVMMLAAFFVLAEGNLPRAQTHRLEEPCGIALIGASLPRRVAAWEQTQGAVVEATQGFTLIELAIVLVIIGLIVGGILVGQNLIKAAETQAQITQIGKFQAAVNAFKNKYNAIPGDMDPISAANFGFTVGGSCTGATAARDGNGVIDGYPSPGTLLQGADETALFWTDLSSSGLIDAQFPNNGGVNVACNGPALILSTTPGTTYIGDYFPAGKIGYGNFIYVYEVNSINWFGLSALTGVASNGVTTSNTTIPVIQAYNIDKKIDDGFPATGSVQATYINNSNTTIQNAPNANPDTASTCYNNSTNTYSTNISNGSNPNCALSFKMQGAAR